MKLDIVWHPVAERQLKAMNWHVAESIDAAVIRFAETGRGDIEWVPPHHRLHVGSYRVLLAVDRATRTLYPLCIYRAR